ncbi:putative nuclear pore complex subunit Nup85 [Aspergillus saccharolyticus JOP 1030-1]|uniref:Nuclear pore complex protein Nup85 n=1 Tax=Aspergillus saccharolyticus JOP 1030-1 TaxID=1450539 RepID=A0A318ZF37_9EURO|nr:hypothetical protein BP01DRAFT_347386 [Aspergillus saccharolyticus JOP 1030-1]PYH42220.1 hypothetical protein BP01DRAFT_347386 [Aspergillus saccharolyticus JOP 1030-1]
MAWKFQLDSSPPSTPGKSRNLFNDLSSTPAGAPPSASNSFTPHGGGPSDFGSSRMSSGSLFTRSGHMNLNDNDSIFGSSIMSNDFLPPVTKKTTTATRSSAPSQSLFSITNGSRFDESVQFRPSNGSPESQMNADGDDSLAEEGAEVTDNTGSSLGVGKASEDAGSRFSFLDSQLGDSIAPQPVSLGNRKSIYSNPVSAKRPKLDERWAGQALLRKGKLPPKKDSAMPSIVRNFASRSRLTTVAESSEFVMSTEDELCRMYDEVRKADYNGTDFRLALSDVCSRLTGVWKKATGQDGPYQESDGIGPGDQALNIAKASFLASLLLQLHHPPRPFDPPGQINPFATRNLLLGGSRTTSPTPVPKFLIDWLDANHIPPASQLQFLKQFEPNPTASSSFWDLLNAAVLRGSLTTAAELLRSADFNYARSALEDGLPQAGYRGTQLQNIQRCVNKALQILESCPSVSRDDWDIKGTEWALFRKRVLAAVTDLEAFAEGEDKASPEPSVQENRFQAVNFGLKATAPAQNFSFTQSARMAESKVPWAIYQNLRSMYRILLGDEDAIMDNAQDWLEATICLTVWWGGDDDEHPSELPPTSLNPLFSRPTRNTPPSSRDDAYLRRLDLAFGQATSADADDASFRVNSLSSLEVGLASVFEGNVEGVIELLQTWSLCVSCAVVEVASIGGWLDSGATEKRTMPGLSEDDLMVLSYGQGQDSKVASSRVNKNDVISTYASGLFERQSIECQDGTRNGWEVALEVLSRLDDREKLQKSVSELLDKLPLNTAEEVDKVVLLCSELDLDNEGRKVSERFGDTTVAESGDYGLALLCYARAHNRRKVKSVVDLLISYSLVQSRAYPASKDLDEQLESLIRDPGRCLAAIAGSDEDAASILQYYFSGYATLRRYYEIRDEAVNLEEGQQPRYKPLARRRTAAQALVAVISSAADSIYGGLYDPDRDSAVQVDGLLTLLGEVLPFIDQPTPILSVSQQFTILSAIEDLQTITPRVYKQCEECFRSTLIEYQSSKNADGSSSTGSYLLPPSPRAMLNKSVSALNASSTFSFIGNEMIESARTRSGSGSAGSSGVLVPRWNSAKGGTVHERGWDWRAGLPDDVAGEDILRTLRLGLARGVSSGGLWSI